MRDAHQPMPGMQAVATASATYAPHDAAAPATIPLRLEEPPVPAVIRAAVEDALETDETRLARLEANGGPRVTEADMPAIEARIAWLQAALDGPRIGFDALKAWLTPKNLASANACPPDEFQWRVLGLATMLGDLPAALFTLEALRSIRTKFLPSDEEIRTALEPTIARWKRELKGLRKLRPSAPVAETRSSSALDPDEIAGDVSRYEAMEDGAVRRAGVRLLLTRIERRGHAELLARYGERLRLMLESTATRQERNSANDDWRDPRDGVEPPFVPSTVVSTEALQHPLPTAPRLAMDAQSVAAREARARLLAEQNAAARQRIAQRSA